MAGSALGSYQTVSVGTADPADLVVQLYDGALRFLRKAQKAAAAGKQPEVATAVNRAHHIIAELESTLDVEKGGEVAEKLEALYTFLLRHLTVGLLEKNPNTIDEAIAILEPLREGFDAARAR
jgi:flagellar protein FliS